MPRLTALLPTLLACTAAIGCASATQRTAPATSHAARAAIDASTSEILKGNSAPALQALRAVPAEAFSPTDAAYRACMFERFERTSPPATTVAVEDAFVADILGRYQRYWWQALATPAQRQPLTDRLEQDLRSLLGERATAAKDIEALEAVLTTELEARGYHAQLGRTPPLQELMLWRRQDTREYRVDLPEGPQTVQVELLDDFVSRGWSSYARCERGSAGGWATDERLYAVVPSYAKDGGLESEAFRVVFLGHEAQHFADQNRYPGILPWELEYRAKLVELAQAETVSAKRLRGFITAQGDDMDSPHTYANKRVVAALAQRLGRSPDQASVAELQAAARAELFADSARRGK